MNKKLIGLLIVGLLVVAPVVSLAYSNPATPSGGLDLATIVGYILGILWIVAFAIAVVMFLIAGIMFMTSMGAPDKVGTARSTAMWAVGGVVVAVVAFSLQQILSTAGILGA